MEEPERRLGALAVLGLSSTLAQAATAAEPCKLLTVQEQVLGASISPPTPIGTTGCLWAAGSLRVTLMLCDASAWPRITMSGPGITKTNISGLGDSASLSSMDKENVLTLSVKQGAAVIVLTVTGVKETEQQRSSEESLARLALRRL